MAHNAQLATLVEDLIQSTNKTSNVDKCKRSAIAAFADASSGRTNQFDVFSRLKGLEEKARILNNDPLADALRARLDELSTVCYEWTPEILSLLLQLSDRPVHESRLDELGLLRPDTPPAPLSWSDIIADVHLDYWEDIWRNVDFAADGSDEDELFEPDDSDTADESASTSLVEIEVSKKRLKDLVVPIDDVELRHSGSAQLWKGSGDEIGVANGHERGGLLTETRAVREVIFMVLGLPTTLFCHNETGGIAISREIPMRHVTSPSVAALLEEFASIGTKLCYVRQWTRRKAEIPLEQTFAAMLSLRLADVDRKLSEIESRILHPCADFIPTLLDLHEKVCHSTRLIQQLDDVLAELRLVTEPGLPFRILECLFDRSCASQRVGDEEAYEFMAELFFECFGTYLRPIRLWMEKGQLDKQDMVMFIRKCAENVPQDSLWQNQYSLVMGIDGYLHAPRFLHLAARKIFNNGKSVDFLRHLCHEEDRVGGQAKEKLEMTFHSVCRPADLGFLSPFPELFDIALDSWVASKHRSSSWKLREHLETQCGLQRSLDALEYIFFHRNGAVSSNAANAIFQWIDQGSGRWNDSSVLTELFQNAYRTISCIDRNCLDVHVDASSSQSSLHRARSSIGVLEDLRISYTLPWAIANIIKPQSMQTYQRVSVLLLQIQRAKYLLQREKLTKRLLATVDRVGLLINDVHHRLLWFVNTMLTYITHMVVSATASSMRTAMRHTVDVDGMIEVHDAYIAQLESRCFLTKPHSFICQALSSLLDLTILLSDIRASYVKKTSSSASDGLVDLKLKSNYAASSAYDGDSGVDSSDESAAEVITEPHAAMGPSDLERLRHVSDTFSKLHSFFMSAVQGVSKADSTACYGMLASSLAAGLRQ